MRKRADKQTPLTCDILAGVVKNNPLPTPAEQANNLVLYLGGRLSSPGSFVKVLGQAGTPEQENIYGLLGIKTGNDEWNDLDFIVTSLGEQRLLKVNLGKVMSPSRGVIQVPDEMSLTLAGWQRVEELRRTHSEASPRQAICTRDWKWK